MKLHYHPDTDTLYIELSGRPSVGSNEISNDVVADFDAEGNIVGLDIEHASKRLDLRTLETESFPASAVKIA
jgi:uncharacterized protein YuzE